jgi:hypothetical protein
MAAAATVRSAVTAFRILGAQIGKVTLTWRVNRSIEGPCEDFSQVAPIYYTVDFHAG